MSKRFHHQNVSRRTLLRGTAGATVALPFLDVMRESEAKTPGDSSPGRAVFCMWGLGLNGRDFTPKETGRDYALTPILKPLQTHRDDLTVISGLKLTHSGGHGGDRTFLTGTNTHDAGSKLRVSADQELAAEIGQDTRFRSLVLGVKRGTGFGNPQDHTLSWSKNGTPLPAENRPHVLFDRLFGPSTDSSD